MTGLAVAATPQHIMNIAQALLAGFVDTDLDCLVLDYRRESDAYTSDVLTGTVGYFANILPQTRFRLRPLWRGISNLQIARDVRYVGRGADTLVLGIYPSGLWARSPIRRDGGRTVLVDDGASSLNLAFDRLLDDSDSLGHGRAYRRLLQRSAGPAVPCAPTPELYTSFPIVASPWPVVRHNYEELRAAVGAHPALGTLVSSHRTIWIDSNFGPSLGPACHREMIAVGVDTFGVDTYVPHRRTSREFAETISREYGLEVVRPDVPVELLIGAWTRAGMRLLTPPTSLLQTAGPFREEPGVLTMVAISEWLRQYGQRHSTSMKAGFAAAIAQAEVLECGFETGGPWLVHSLT
jgi:hypothetical protein